jgi:WXXGXW repeat (2 copies)
MKTKLIILMLVASSAAFAGTHFSIGVSVGGPGFAGYFVTAPPPAPPVYYAPPSPGPGFVWVSGYYYPVGHRYEWRPGYWTRPPHGHSKWVEPRYHKNRYYPGHWR